MLEEKEGTRVAAIGKGSLGGETSQGQQAQYSQELEGGTELGQGSEKGSNWTSRVCKKK